MTLYKLTLQADTLQADILHTDTLHYDTQHNDTAFWHCIMTLHEDTDLTYLITVLSFNDNQQFDTQYKHRVLIKLFRGLILLLCWVSLYCVSLC